MLKKGGLRPPFLFADLLTQTQLCNDCTIAVDVLLGKIVKQASALTDHHQKTAAGVVVVLVNTQVLGQLVDSGGQDSNLDLGRTGVAGMGCVLLNDSSLFFLAHHSVFPPFKNHFPLPKLQVWQNRPC